MGHCLIFAIDFGTTYSGIGRIHTAQENGCHIGASLKCNLLTQWLRYNKTSEKAPTEILYENHPRQIKWGWEAYKNIRAHRYFKLNLDPQGKAKLQALLSATQPTQPLVDTRNHRRSRGRGHGRDILTAVGEEEADIDPKKLCTDYLHALYQAALAQMDRARDWWPPDVVKNTPRRFILTVPAMWTDAAKNTTKQCARRAFGHNADIELIPEPQAAAIYTLKQAHVAGSVRPGENFVICDAGGGTVDLITYRVKNVNPLELVESIPGTGDMCGSIFLNRAFESFLENRLGTFYSSPRSEQMERALKRMRTTFDDAIKVYFDGSNEDEWELPLPREMYCARVHGVDEDRLIITSEDVRRIFEPVIRKIIALIKDQISRLYAQSSGSRVAGIILVGGFSQNEYLYNRVHHEFRDRARVIRPQDAWASVVLGALCWGLDNQTVTGRVLTRCYGQEIYRPYDAGFGYPMVPHPVTGERSCKVMRWFVYAGQEVSTEQPLRFDLKAYCHENESADLKITLIAWSPSKDSIEPPDVLTERCYKVGDMTIDLDKPRRRTPHIFPRADGRGNYQKLDFTMELLFSSEIVFRAIFEGTTQIARVDYCY
ncbi:hypothetical protein BBP40_005964 [Aspergillus hancockii]|nr:hypothetical protein BBP40_005964 [Aspergillus hancockii]